MGALRLTSMFRAEIGPESGAREAEPKKGGGHMFRVVREYAKFALSALSSVMYHTT